METAARRNACEATILSSFVQRGYGVLVPFGGGHPYDLVVELGSGLLRVQCKRAWSYQGCVVFNARTTDHGQGRRSYRGLADIFGVHFPPTSNVYLVPVEAVEAAKGWLRLEPTRNNQRRRVKFAADYEIDRWTPDGLREVVTSRRLSPGLALSIA
jgi:hypothetical protein